MYAFYNALFWLTDVVQYEIVLDIRNESFNSTTQVEDFVNQVSHASSNLI